MHVTRKPSLLGKAAPGLAALALLGPAAPPPAQAQIVANGGFETGDFSGWAVSGPLATVDVDAGHSGQYAASLGAIAPDTDTLSQTLATVAGQQYVLTFFAQTPEYGAGHGQPNSLSVSFGGVVLDAPFTVPDDPAYHQYTYSVTATSGSSVLEFSVYNTPDYTQLDDISLTPAAVPEPSQTATIGLGVLGLAGLSLGARRRRSAPGAAKKRTAGV